MTRQEIIELATSLAQQAGLDPALVLAVIEQESAFNPWAVRFEPRFYEKYTKPMNLTDTEEYCRAISWGLMQVMGQVGREQGFPRRYLSELLLPENGLYHGMLKLKRCIAKTETIAQALLRYNGGGNPKYDDEVLEKYEQWKKLL